MKESKTMNKDKLQQELKERMLDLFSTIADEKRVLYTENPNEIPAKSEIHNIISTCGNQNAAISGAISLVPGPLGMAAAVPEIVLIIRNQAKMICDIGAAMNQVDVITQELLAAVFTETFARGKLDLISIDKGKLTIKKTSTGVFQEMVTLLAGRLTQQLLRAMISKWIPVVGAVAVSAWSKYSTRMIGKKAEEFFQKEIKILEDLEEKTIKIEAESIPVIDESQLIKNRILSLSNLMKIDSKIKVVEFEYIENMIKNSNLDDKMKDELRQSVTATGMSEVDYSVFPKGYIETIGLIIDMVALAKRDGEFHAKEKAYIMDIGCRVGMLEEQIQAIMDT